MRNGRSVEAVDFALGEFEGLSGETAFFLRIAGGLGLLPEFFSGGCRSCGAAAFRKLRFRETGSGELVNHFGLHVGALGFERLHHGLQIGGLSAEGLQFGGEAGDRGITRGEIGLERGDGGIAGGEIATQGGDGGGVAIGTAKERSGLSDDAGLGWFSDHWHGRTAFLGGDLKGFVARSNSSTTAITGIRGDIEEGSVGAEHRCVVGDTAHGMSKMTAGAE